jgi:rubrerythrin
MTFQASQFTPTKWDTAQDKTWFAKQFVRFVQSDFAVKHFTDRFYRRLSNTFGHIAHYNRGGFWEEFFARTADKVRFLEQTLQYPCYGERYEFRDMYPDFIQKAEAEGNRAAAISFRNANAVEKIHHELYTKALETLAAGKDLPPAAIHVCEVCGNTVIGEAPEKCPVCGAPRTKFKEVA